MLLLVHYYLENPVDEIIHNYSGLEANYLVNNVNLSKLTQVLLTGV